MNAIDLLKEVRSFLSDPQNWRKGDYGDYRSDGPCCILGAARRAAYKAGESVFMYDEAMHDLLGSCVPQEWVGKTGSMIGRAYVARFNDDPDTTHEGVLRALDCAIAQQEALIS